MKADKAFFRNASHGQMTLGDIFSDVFQKHTATDSARVFMAGTPLTTPAEKDMLAQWQKPFLFARFLMFGGIFLLLCYVFATMHPGGVFLLMLGLSCIVSMALLLLVWEMNIPRNISLGTLLIVVCLGGVLSLIATLVLEQYSPFVGSIWAPATEEPAKLLIAYLIVRKKNYKFILNGILIGVAVGAGFSMFENIFYSFRSLMQGGLMGGLITAVIRALTDIAGHGLYAGLYTGALVMVKGSEPLSPKHLVNPQFLMYFAMSFGLHMLNNSGLLGGVMAVAVIMTILAVGCFFPMLRKGVNQVVNHVIGLNNYRLTYALDSESASSGHRHHHARGETPHHIQATVLTGPMRGQTHRLNVLHTIAFGRTPDKCKLCLDGYKSVSRIHCTLKAVNGVLHIEDYSTYGTYVGDKRLPKRKPTKLPSGSVIYLGGKDCGVKIVLE